MTDIPQVDDQFIEEASEEVTPRMPSIAGRFPIYFASEIEVDRIRGALVSAGFYLHGDGDGHWCVDQIHAMALVRAANEPEASAPAMWAHDCPVEKTTINTARDQRCSWCGATEPEGESA